MTYVLKILILRYTDMNSSTLPDDDQNYLHQEVFLQFLSKKYTFSILKQLQINETKRFNKLVKNIGTISTKTMSRRLKELVEYGLVFREQFNEIPPRVEYSLTNKGLLFIKSVDTIMRENKTIINK